MAKWGWKLSYSRSSDNMDYLDLDEEPYATKEEAFEAAEEASGNRSLGIQMNIAYGNTEGQRDPGPAQIEVFKV